jgi:hypothetical protein
MNYSPIIETEQVSTNSRKRVEKSHEYLTVVNSWMRNLFSLRLHALAWKYS